MNEASVVRVQFPWYLLLKQMRCNLVSKMVDLQSEMWWRNDSVIAIDWIWWRLCLNITDAVAPTFTIHDKVNLREVTFWRSVCPQLVYMFLKRYVSNNQVMLFNKVDQVMPISICIAMKREALGNLGIHITPKSYVENNKKLQQFLDCPWR